MNAVPNPAPRTTLAIAKAYAAAGLSVVAIKPDGSKRPPFTWAEFTKRRATEKELRLWFSSGQNGIGIICGAISGGLEVQDFDKDVWAQWRALVDAEVPSLTSNIPVVATPGNGVHVFYRCSTIDGNQKLAVDSSRHVVIETRGEGGLVVAPGSPRNCHPSGRPYRLLHGDLTAIPTITPEHRGFLLDAARSFNEYVTPQQAVRAPAPQERVPNDGQRPGDAFNARTTWPEILEPAGWHLVQQRGEVGCWKRPGKDDVGWSATTNHAGSDLLYVFSSNAAPFEPERSYDRFAAYALLHHGGDFRAAAQELLAQGYGDRPLEVDLRKEKKREIVVMQSEPAEWVDPPDDAALYGLAGDVVRACGPHTEADGAGILAQFLAAFANVVGPGPHVVVGATRHRAILNVVIVGRSSRARKGDSWQYVSSLVSRADPDWAMQCVTTGLSTGEGLIHAVRDPSNEDESVRDRRALIVETEFGRTLRVMARDGNTLSAVLRDAWDGRDLRVMTRGQPLRATGAHVGIIGHVTLGELRRELSSTDATNGFANRFDWFCVRRSQALADPPPLPDDTREHLIDRIRGTLAASQHIGVMTRDNECRVLWEKLYPDLTVDQNDLAGEVLSRSEAQVLRLSIVYALLDASPIICRPHLEAALAVWDYCVASVRYVFGSALNDTLADEILRHLQSAGELTRSEISGALAHRQSSARIQVALSVLETAGLAKKRLQQTGGRPVEIWSPTGKQAGTQVRLVDALRGLISQPKISDIRAPQSGGGAYFANSLISQKDTQKQRNTQEQHHSPNTPEWPAN